ncbi:MAG TPA: MFS transporter [Solirubrobacterales bacterium]|nr:MFS transporter [Solirubrobacterales bacterium]
MFTSRTTTALAFGAGGFFLVYFGQVVLGVVQPEIQSDLGLDHDEALWVVNAFMLGLAAFVPLGGRLADVAGPRRGILAGLAVMALGAAGAALAPEFGALIASLAVQGAGAGVAIAGTVAIVTGAYPPDHRGQAVGVYVGLGVLALPIAPLAAGALIDAGEWRLTFWLALVLTLAVLGVGALGLPAEHRRDERVDTGAAVIAIASLALILGGAVEATAWGWTAPATIAVLVAGVVLLVGFVTREAGSRQPLVDLALVRDRTIGGSAAALFLTQMGTSGVAIFVPIYLLTIVRLDPLATGVAMLAAMAFRRHYRR